MSLPPPPNLAGEVVTVVTKCPAGTLAIHRPDGFAAGKNIAPHRPSPSHRELVESNTELVPEEGEASSSMKPAPLLAPIILIAKVKAMAEELSAPPAVRVSTAL